MIVYHGSQEIVQKPEYGKGKTYNDYGQGFYLTESEELAKEWACPILKNGFINKYQLDIESLSTIYLDSENFNILNWLAILLKNRELEINKNNIIAKEGRNYIIENFMPKTEGFDVIIGYRADDRYFAFAKDFVQNGLTVNQLALAMKYGNLGEQIFLKSKKAFATIQFLESKEVDGSIYYEKRKERERLANLPFEKLHEKTNFVNELLMSDILREKIKNEDPRLW